mgnify:CR=1 FL=1
MKSLQQFITESNAMDVISNLQKILIGETSMSSKMDDKKKIKYVKSELRDYLKSIRDVLSFKKLKQLLDRGLRRNLDIATHDEFSGYVGYNEKNITDMITVYEAFIDYIEEMMDSIPSDDINMTNDILEIMTPQGLWDNDQAARDLINIYYKQHHGTLSKDSCEDNVSFLLNIWNNFCLEVIYTEWCDPYNIR